MLALKTTPLEAILPGNARRRTWFHPELSSHTVLVLTYDRLYLAPHTGSPKPGLLAAIDAGADLDMLLDPQTTMVDLATIQRLTLDLMTNSLSIESAGSGQTGNRLRLTFTTPEAADACFTRIWRRLGEKFQLTPYKRETAKSVQAPLAVLALILVLTAAMAGLLSIHQDRVVTRIPTTGSGESVSLKEPTRSNWDTVLDWMNWKVICGLGGIAAAGSQVWLYRRLTTPPVSLELIRA